MVRNTFMNLRGYMLVFTGTPDLFPVMDEVFSPIVRQFKRIEVEPFADISETRRAVLGPLKSVNQEQLFDMPPPRMFDDPSGMRYRLVGGDLVELHELSGGRPYEIQLVCHLMFKRVQQKKDPNMTLSLDLLEDVLVELRQSHDDELRPTITSVKSLENQELNDLEILLQSGGRFGRVEIANASYIALDTTVPPTGLLCSLEKFKQKKVVRETEKGIAFYGDDFDKIVCKYVARQRGVQLSFEPVSPSSIIKRRIDRAHLSLETEKRRRRGSSGLILAYSSGAKVEEEKRMLESMWTDIDSTFSIAAFCKELPEFLINNYRYLIDEANNVSSKITFYRIEIKSNEFNFVDYFFLTDHIDSECAASEITTTLAKMEKNTSAVGGSFEVERKPLRGASIDELFDQISLIERTEARFSCAKSHFNEMYTAYVHDQNTALAEFHAVKAMFGVDSLQGEERNNIGFVLLATENYELASKVLEFAKDDSELGLARYNFAISRAMCGGHQEAASLLSDIIQNENSSPTDNIGVLFFLGCDEQGLVLEQRWANTMNSESDIARIELLEAAEVALRSIQK